MTTHLEHHDPAVNCFRFYRLEVQVTLFGDWSLIRNWGRIGSWGRTAISSYATRSEAEAAKARMTRLKTRRGYVRLGQA